MVSLRQDAYAGSGHQPSEQESRSQTRTSVCEVSGDVAFETAEGYVVDLQTANGSVTTLAEGPVDELNPLLARLKWRSPSCTELEVRLLSPPSAALVLQGRVCHDARLMGTEQSPMPSWAQPCQRFWGAMLT